MLTDVLVVILLLGALAWGIGSGVLAILGSAVGLAVGGVAVWWLLPIVAPLLPGSDWRGPVLIAGVVALLVGGAIAGGAIGSVLRRGAEKLRLHVIDRLLGGAVAVVATALSLSLVAQSAAVSGVPLVSAATSSSRVLATIDALTPAPVSAALAQLRQAVFVDALPRMGTLLDLPATAPTAPPVALDDPALSAAAQSVARISGTAFSCARGMTGSGFVIADDRVVTNAHVVAGMEQIVVELPGRIAQTGLVVWFDPDQDLAVIAVETEDAAALQVVPTLRAGDTAAVAGYPYGGPFTLGQASVRSVGTAQVPDIYDSGSVSREIYALDARVAPGNSGGPVLTAGGDAAGVVFARADDGTDVGYAVTSGVLAPLAEQASALVEPVSTGSCTPSRASAGGNPALGYAGRATEDPAT
ncbi:MAG: serine protease [Microbacterium sp.]|nr:serine protease [Microbacterium sp.]HBU41832.1 serine protease [Microbacterium sp.]